jgi:ABC-2 type transport system ATP-binding protein
VRNEIVRLRSSQRTIIICSHNLIEAEMLADKIAIIYHGRILLMGTLAELRQRMLGPVEYEVKLAGSWKGNDLELPPGVMMIEKGSHGFRYTVEDPQQANPLILAQLVQSELLVTAMQEMPRSLEMIYLKAMTQAAQGAL